MPLISLRRRPLLALAATSLALTLAACGGGGGSSGDPVTPPPAPVTLTVTHKVRITTSQGVIELGLDRTHAPITVDNFLKYVNDGFYNGTIFHRVIGNFVIQGGGVVRDAAGTALVEKTPTYAAIALESQNGLANVRGTLAMARTAVANSATSQFYVNVVDNPSLNYQNPANPGYAVFGQVTTGMDVVDKIRAVATNAADVPLVDITITDAKVMAL